MHESRSFRADVQEFMVVLSGDLDGSVAVREELQQKLRRLALCGDKWIVRAVDATVIPAGVEQWSRAVKAHLCGCRLRYEPSQLATILRFDESYDHERSEFLDEEIPASKLTAEFAGT